MRFLNSTRTHSRTLASITAFPIVRISVVSLLALTSLELGGIWKELRGIRAEQVKSTAFALPDDQIARLRTSEAGRARLRELAAQTVVRLDTPEPIPVKAEQSRYPVLIEAPTSFPTTKSRREVSGTALLSQH
jgi:hypothetical protein